MRTKLIKVQGNKEILVKYLNRKEAVEYYSSDSWELDSIMSSMCKDSTFVSITNGSVLIKREDGATVYESRNDVNRLFNFLDSSYGNYSFQMKDLPFGKDFIHHIPEIVESLHSKLDLKPGTLDYSLKSVLLIDSLFNSKNIDCFYIESRLMPELVVYFGEIIRLEFNGSWRVKQEEFSESNAIEPIIVTSAGEFSPFWMISEEISENEGFAFFDALLAEITKYKLLKK